MLCFTMEEVWLSRFPGDESSVHLEDFPETPPDWLDPALAARWQEIRRVRRVVTGALEVERGAKRIGASLETAPVVHVEAETAALLADLDFAELCITSEITVSTGPAPEDAFRLPETQGIAVVPAPARGTKCQRCWRILPEVGLQSDPNLCARCVGAVGR